MNKSRSSTKIAIGFVLLAGALYGGMTFYSNWRISHFNYLPIKPGRVNIVGVDLGAGFRIVVANQMAQLRQASPEEMTQMGPGDAGTKDEDDSMDSDESAKKSRIPIREMLGAMQGDESQLSKFVMILNNINDDSLPPERIYWAASDIEKALDGDKALRAKLERDLNVSLDGTPLPELRISSLEDGIVIKAPVPVKVQVGSQQKTLTATVLQPYKPKLMRDVEFQYEKKAQADKTMMLGYYVELSKAVLANPKTKENVAETLKDMLSPQSLATLAVGPEHVLQGATVVINDSMITDASYSTYQTTSGKSHDLSIHLTGEGSDRLWKYSKGKVGTQLLLVADGIAIAAPRIRYELSERSLVITQMPDETLVKEAVDMINKHRGEDKPK